MLQIHTKKRNKLEQQRWNDLVYVKYNQKLKERYDRRDVINPISLATIDESNEWLIGKMDANVEENELMFDEDDDDLTLERWMHNTKTQARSKANISTSQHTFEEEDDIEEQDIDG